MSKIFDYWYIPFIAGFALAIASMFIGAVAFIGAVVIEVVAIVMAMLKGKTLSRREDYDKWVGHSHLMVFIIVLVIIVFGAIAIASIHKVDAGEEDVVVSSPNGQVGNSYDAGLYFDPSFILSSFDTVRYNTQTSEYIGGTDSEAIDNDGCIMILSSDALYVYIDMSVTYSIDKSHVSDLRIEFGNDWKVQLIHQNVRSIPRELALNYRALDLATDNDARSEFQVSIIEKLTEKIQSDSKGYIKVSNIAIREVRFANELISKINEKMNAQQDLERAGIEKQTASVRAESEKQVAIVNAQKQLELAQRQLEIEQANLEVAKTKAQAEAQAITIKAQADADATRLKAEAEADRYNLIITEFGSVEAYNEFIKNQNTNWGIVPSGSSTIVVTP